MRRLFAIAAVGVLLAGCTTSSAAPTSQCSVAVTTTRQEASAVQLPPANGYPGKRPVPTIAYPDIPINAPQIGC